MSSPQILVVEDEKIIAMEISDRLKDMGYDVLSIVSRGEDAIAKAEEHLPDLALMDIMLQGEMDGVETARQIRSRFDIPIIYLTAFASKDTLDRAKITEPYGYLIKPFDEKELHTSIEMALYKHKTEQKLKTSEERYRVLYDNNPSMYFTVDADGIFQSVNAYGLQKLKYSAAELEGKSMFSLVHPEDRDKVVLQLAESVGRQNQIVQWESRIISKNGSFMWVVESARCITKATGDLEILIASEDITERKQAEDELAAEKERLAVTLRSIGDGVITTDIRGNVVLLNKVAEQLTGWTQAEAAEKPFDEIFHIIDEETGVRRDNPVQNVLKTGKIIGFKRSTILTARDGTERIVADSCAPIYDPRSKVVGAVLVFRDISEERKREEELQKTQKLESIGILAGGLAHDFNNILTAILANISLVKSELPPDCEMAEILSEAENASLQATNLTHQLLTFSKGGAPVKEAMSIAEIIVNSVNFSLSGSNVKCEYSLPDDLWPVEVDGGQMSQVIQNLTVNAKQAMPDGGVIRVSAKNVKTAHEKNLPQLMDGNFVRISIADEGSGIPEDTHAKIYDPYFTTKPSGSGLGLTIAYSIVRRHGGFLTFDSKVERGSTFFIYLPISAVPVKETAPVPEKSSKGRQRILLMDDEDFIRNMVSRLLPRFGFRIEVAKDGEEAVEQYTRAKKTNQPFDVVVMDLTIPGGMGGKEAILKLREIDPEVKALVSSGYSNDPIMADFKTHGFAGVISKPYRIQELINSINEILD